MYITQDPITVRGGNRFYAYVKDTNFLLDVYALAESVYQLVDSDGNVVYYGITDRPPLERANEHVRDGKDFAHMEVLADDLTHDQARSLEGGLIRERLADNVDKYLDTDSVEDKLSKSGLLNKNRGRVEERWISKDPVGDVPQLKDKKKIVPTTCR